jgi:hypothetical protein
MKGLEMKRRFGGYVRSSGAVALFCIVSMTALAQEGTAPPKPIAGGLEQVKELPPGGPAPRTPDGHPDLSGRWYPNGGGRMLQRTYMTFFGKDVRRQFDPKVVQEEPPVFKPGMEAKYRGKGGLINFADLCGWAGVPSAILMQITQNWPMQLIQTPGQLVQLIEFPRDIRVIHTDGRPHHKDPDPTFNGDSVAHWDGDALVIDTIALDPAMGITGLAGPDGLAGGGAGWAPSDHEHVIERITRPSMNFINYQITIEDSVVLAKPWNSAPRRWSLAGPNDDWEEQFCTNESDLTDAKNVAAQAAKAKPKAK